MARTASTVRTSGRQGIPSKAVAAEVRSAVSFKTGEYEPDFHALATESAIVLPWDREVLIDGALVPNPLYETALKAEDEEEEQ